MYLRESFLVKHVNTTTNAYQTSVLRINTALTGVRVYLCNHFAPKTPIAHLASIVEESKCSACQLKTTTKLAKEMKNAPIPWHAQAVSASYMGHLRTMKFLTTIWLARVGSLIKAPLNLQFVSPHLK